jgi:formylglycine-generating enzyme required for sulfatase activity
MERETTISPGQMVEIRGVQLEAALVRLTLVTDVAGAAVLVDGESVGQTTAGESQFEVPVSSGTLRVIRLGRQPFATLLSLSTSSGQRIEFSMPELDGPDGQDSASADCSRVGSVDRTRQCAIPASEATMGSDAPWAPSDAGPERLVLLTQAFRVHRDEVSVGSYQRCVEAGACASPGADNLVETSATNALCNWGQMGHADHPMNCISGMAAQTYCEWAGGSLPTEAQWERAARGTDGRLVPWALTTDETIIDACQWMSTADCTGRASGTSAIGEFPDSRSPYGLQDVLGNVSEWTLDAYESDAYLVLPSTDPISDVGTSRRVVRGTSFVSVHAQDALVARARIPSTATLSWVGFRCVFPH